MEQVEEERWVREAGADSIVEVPPHVTEPVTTAVVAVAAGDGIKRIFYSLGRAGHRGRRPVDEPVDRRPAGRGRGGAGRAGRDPAQQQEHHPGGRAGRRPHRPHRAGGGHPGHRRGRSPPSWATTPRRRADENAKEMAALSASVLAGEVTQAVRDSTSDVGPIARGRLPRHRPRGHQGGRADRGRGRHAGCSTCWSTDDHEIVTVIEGEGATAADTRAITEWLGEHRPEVVARGPPRRPAALPVPASASSSRRDTRPDDRRAHHPRRAGHLAGHPPQRGGRPQGRGRWRRSASTSMLDLLTYYPRRYVDRTNEARIRDLVVGEEAMVLVTVVRTTSPPDAGPSAQGARHRRRPRRQRQPAGHVLQPGVAGAPAAPRG